MSAIDQFIARSIPARKMGVIEFAEGHCAKDLYPLQKVLLKLLFLEEMDGREEDLLDWMIRGGRSGEITTSPDLRKRRDMARDAGFGHFSEIDLIGGRRSSKGYLIGLAGAYKLWQVHQLDDPARFYNVDADKVLDFICVAASFDQAKTLQFADLRAAIGSCDLLAPYISKDIETILTVKHDTDVEYVQRRAASGNPIARDFARLRARPMAANSDTIRGTASILAIFDEFAFFLPGESRQSAQQVYDALEPSLAQFGPHALIFLSSSPWTKVGPFYDAFMNSMLSDSHTEWYPRNIAIQFPSWALYDKWWLDGRGRWENAIMVSPDWPGQLEDDEPRSALDAFSLVKQEQERNRERSNPDTYKVERRGQWAEVLDAYLDPARVDLAFAPVKPDGQPCAPNYGGTYHYAYAGHCDPSSTTAGFGFAMGHVEEFEDPSGVWPDGKARHVVFDFVKAWRPDDFAGHTINYISVREELAHYVQVFRPVSLTFDQYNSAGLIQELREDARKLKIFNVQIHEVTATAKVNWNRWEAFKTALYLGLVHIPPGCVDPRTGFDSSEWAKLELKFLQEVQTGQTKRVDKQELGPVQTKDIADCIAEVTVKFLGSYLGDLTGRAFEGTHLLGGAEGGYQIGGRNPQGPRGGERFDEYLKGRQAGANATRGFDATGRYPRRRSG